MFMNLYVPGESLHVIGGAFIFNNVMEVWKMNKYGDSKSWLRRFSIVDYHIRGNVDHFFNRLPGIRKTREFLWSASRRLLISYDHAHEVEKSTGVLWNAT